MNLKLMLIMVFKVMTMLTLLDVSVQATGTVDNVFAIAQANSISVTAALVPGTQLIIPTVLPYVAKNTELDAAVVAVVQRIKVKSKQSFHDVSIQYTGSVENAFAIAQANQMSVSDALVPGTMLTVPVLKKEVKTLNYYTTRTIVPATGKMAIVVNLEYLFCMEFPLSF